MKWIRSILSKSFKSAHTALVLLPASLTLLVVALLLSHFYFSGVASLAESHRLRLGDLLSHLAAGLDSGQSTENVALQMESFGRSTPRSESFHLHIFLLSGDRIIASTDRSAIGEIYEAGSPLLRSFFQKSGEATVSASLPIHGNRTLVAHEDITVPVSDLRKSVLELAALAIVIVIVILWLQHFLFRLRVTAPVLSMAAVLSELFSDLSKAETDPDLPPEFQPMLKAWNETRESLGSGIRKLIQAESRGSIVLLTNAFRHSLVRIADLMAPVSSLPTRVLSASQISDLHVAQRLVLQLHQTLDETDPGDDPLNLCKKILSSEEAEFEDRSRL